MKASSRLLSLRVHRRCGRLFAAFWSWLGKGGKTNAAVADEPAWPEVTSAIA